MRNIGVVGKMMILTQSLTVASSCTSKQTNWRGGHGRSMKVNFVFVFVFLCFCLCLLYLCLCLLCLCLCLLCLFLCLPYLCLCLWTNGYPEQIGEIDVKERREGATHKEESSLKLPFASLSRSSLMEREILNLIWKCCQKDSNQNLCLKHSFV